MTDLSKKEREEGTAFSPKFDKDGLIPCITTSAKSGEVLMFAYMNEEALQKSIETGQAYYWSRSRAELWHKGATSGMIQTIVEMKVDCDQDCLWISVEIAGKQAACHTGHQSCFYRSVVAEPQNGISLSLNKDKKAFDPKDIYKGE